MFTKEDIDGALAMVKNTEERKKADEAAAKRIRGGEPLPDWQAKALEEYRGPVTSEVAKEHLKDKT